MDKPLRGRTDDELASDADRGLSGQGNIIESMRRLRQSNVVLTWVLIVLTLVLVLLGASHFAMYN